MVQQMCLQVQAMQTSYDPIKHFLISTPLEACPPDVGLTVFEEIRWRQVGHRHTQKSMRYLQQIHRARQL